MNINTTRLLNKLDTINRIGYREGKGITRLSMTDEDIYARKAVKDYLTELGLSVSEDGVGNIWATLYGKNSNLPIVLVGSHIDTVPNGGGYDGTLGVMAAIEAIEMIIENNLEHEHTIELVIFSTEESSRFNISTVGSKILTGGIGPQDLNSYKDHKGISLGDALRERSLNPNTIRLLDYKKYKAFFELHIEQGQILEKAGIDIGIVKGIAAPTRLKINLYGVEAHSGSCPMRDRKDALVAAAEVIIAVEKKGREESFYGTVATTGKCDVFPGVMNVVPGQTELYIDIRGIHKESINRTYIEILDRVNDIAITREIANTIEVISREEPVMLDKELNKLVEQSCHQLGLSSLEMLSGAGHDTMNMAKVIPSTLIFVPCVNGISHNKHEAVNIKDLENSVKIVLEMLLKLAR